MNNSILLATGEQYPLPISPMEGAAAHFLGRTGSILQVGMPGLLASEIRSIRSDPMMAGLIKDGPLILWVFVFGTFILECPFDARLLPSSMLDIPSVERSSRLSVDIQLVDVRTNILRVLREISLPERLTRKFAQAAFEQLADARAMDATLAHYRALPLERLSKLAAVEQCGK